jgi:hypothetical protein
MDFARDGWEQVLEIAGIAQVVSMNVYGLPDFERHQVLANLQGTTVRVSRFGDEIIYSCR